MDSLIESSPWSGVDPSYFQRVILKFSLRNMPAFRGQGLCPLLDGAVHDTIFPVSGCGAADAESTQSKTEKEFTPQSIPKTILFIKTSGKRCSRPSSTDMFSLDILFHGPRTSNVVEDFHLFTSSHNQG
jgi:hypothetical protein